MNDQLKFETVKLRVCPDNESFFNDSFWESKDIIINALDNV